MAFGLITQQRSSGDFADIVKYDANAGRLFRVDYDPALHGYQFAAGSMGPTVEAAARFAAKTGRRAAIGALDDIAAIVAGTAGTNVVAWAASRPGAGPG